MELTIKGTPEEIAALVRATQERQAVKIEFGSPVKTMTKVVSFTQAVRRGGENIG